MAASNQPQNGAATWIMSGNVRDARLVRWGCRLMIGYHGGQEKHVELALTYSSIAQCY